MLGKIQCFHRNDEIQFQVCIITIDDVSDAADQPKLSPRLFA